MATGQTRIGNSDYISSGAPTEDPGTGAFNGEYFDITGNGTGAGIFFLNNAVSIIYGNDDEVSAAFDGNGLNFVLGQNDDVYLAYDANESVIDIGKGSAVDILANTGPLYLYDFQNDPTARLILPPGESTSPILFVGIQVTAADLALSDTTGAYSLQMYNGATLVDSTQISEVGASVPSFSLTPESYGAYLTQGLIPGSIGVPVLYNLSFQDNATTKTLNTINGESLYLKVTDDGATLNVNVAGTLNLNAQVVESFGTMKFIGGSIDFVGVSSFGGGSVLFDDNLTGTGTIDERHESNSAGSGFVEINGSVGSGLTLDMEGGGPPESMQIDNPSSFMGTIDLEAGFLGGVTFEGLHITSAYLGGGINGPPLLEMTNDTTLVDIVRLGGSISNLFVQQTASGVVVGESTSPVVGNLFHSLA